MQVFLSHNHGDKPIVRVLAAQLRLVGADVWLDEWEILPGDSIPGAVEAALMAADTVLIIWSENASSSRWVGTEMATAITRHHNDGSVRLIPVRLDGTPLPGLLQHLRWVEMPDDSSAVAVVQKIMGFGTRAEVVRAVQEAIDESTLRYKYFPGFGVAVGCPRCGVEVDLLEHTHAIDYERDDEYAGVRCTACGWQDGGEI
ncbi:toll/interleukin-1 receptor domain-containing protein [Nonomuraea sp. NPDC050663]|uniref:toll/interleukin-1 receptor domain-containing protein n=1 Tax=Nonomuraea sp. NPDC050663 TaxID=3364370 RepID=UPI0037A4B658